MKKCYLAGPMRSKPAYNYPAFFEGEEKLREAGWTVFNPARMDRDSGDNTSLKLTLEQQGIQAGSPQNTRRYAARDLAVIIHDLRAEDGDVLVVLPDWEQSTGAFAEVAVAKWVGLPIIPLEEVLRG